MFFSLIISRTCSCEYMTIPSPGRDSKTILTRAPGRESQCELAVTCAFI